MGSKVILLETLNFSWRTFLHPKSNLHNHLFCTWANWSITFLQCFLHHHLWVNIWWMNPEGLFLFICFHYVWTDSIKECGSDYQLPSVWLLFSNESMLVVCVWEKRFVCLCAHSMGRGWCVKVGGRADRASGTKPPAKIRRWSLRLRVCAVADSRAPRAAAAAAAAARSVGPGGLSQEQHVISFISPLMVLLRTRDMAHRMLPFPGSSLFCT